MTVLGVIFAGISGIGGLAGVGSLLLWRSQNKKLASESRKLDVEGDVLMSDKALEMYEAMSIRATAAETKAEHAEKKASLCIKGTYELIDHIYLLRRVMAKHDIEPPPFQFPVSITGAEAV